ncbi:MAG TPA: rhomboid family intramembrane serine protease [Anaerolineae bacterium]|nr:rhomboid family intramembrane serine protease [Anaerolineae bacterium]HQK13762.1 rhomboid family intramembrane serine protease [Anaerolineae bacterium]
MIPLGDDIPSRRFPTVTLGLIVVNTLVFFFEVLLGPRADLLAQMFGATPIHIMTGWTNPLTLVTLFTAMYLHGGWAHLIGNMLYLWIFGDNVEDRMGHGRFFVFYTLCGVLSGMAQVLAMPTSRVPAIGASGAIAGVLGAYLLLFPHARIRTLIPLFFFYTTIYLPAILVLGGWFLVQFLNGIASLSVNVQVGGVAWWAHIGGFASGMLLMPIFRQKQPPTLPPFPYYYDGSRYWHDDF